MSLTLGNWLFIGFVLCCGIVITGLIWYSNDCFSVGVVVNAIITIILVVGMIFFFNWYNTSTASGMRGYKDFQSELSNGIYRELVITAEDGREIFRYEGKFDIERHADGDDRYLRFESQDGKRYTISYGVQDTVIIIEKDKVED